MLYIHKPLTADSNSALHGAVTTFEVDSSAFTTASDVASMVNSDNSGSWYNTYAIPNVGYPETSPHTPAEWGGTSGTTNLKSLVIRVTSIGSNMSPTIADLNNTQLVTQALHSNSSNNFNGTTYLDQVTGWTWDASNMQVTTTIAGVSEVVGFDQYSTTIHNYSTAALALASGMYTQSLTDLNLGQNANWYYNGILHGTSYGSGSGNEDYETTYWKTSNDPSTDMATLIGNIDIQDILLNEESIPRTDLMFIENVLKNSSGISDEIKLALSFLLAYAKSNQADTKKLNKNFNKTRATMNITSLQTLENTYRKG